jgi:NNP family nitrate/nitrite transporter-like MFS transporter
MSNTKASGADIADWRPEDAQFWETTGKRVASRNLWISIPNLLVAFAVWAMPSVNISRVNM